MKTYTKKYLAMLLVFVMMLTVLPWNVFAAGGDDPAEINNVSPQTLTYPKKGELSVSGTFDQLTAEVTNDTNVISVEGPTGPVSDSATIILKPLNVGQATITLMATNGGSESATREVHVTVTPGTLKVEPSSLTIVQGGKDTFKVKGSGGNDVNATLTMTGLTVNGLEVTAPANAEPKTYQGEITAENYEKVPVTVQVNPKMVEIKTLTVKPVTMKEGETQQLTVTLTPENASVTPTFSVKNNSTGITVSPQGVITATKAGNYEVIVNAGEYGTKTVPVTVNPKDNSTPPASEEYVVTFVSNGGTAVASQGTINQKLNPLPTDPTRAGYTFDGWYTKADFTSPRVTTSTLFTDNTTLYAKWILVTDQVKLRNVTWDSNGVKGYTNVPNATVVLYRYSDNVEVARTTSDSNGYFSIATDFFNKYWYGNNYWHDNNYWWYDGYYYNGHTYREAKDFYDEYGYWPSWWRDGYYYGYRGNYGYLIGYKTGYQDSAKEYVGSNYWYDSDYWWDGRYWNDRNWWYDSDREGNYRIYPTNIDRGNYWVSGYTNYSNTRVYVYDGNTYLGSTTTDRSGYFKLSWNSPSVPTTRTLQYYIHERYSSNQSEYSIVPVATSAEAGSRTVKGKAGDYAKVVLFDKSGVKLGETTADKNGNFSIYTSRALIAGETLTMTAEESTKKVSTGSVIVPGAAVSAVLSAQNRPYVTGYPDGNFRPQGNVTRAEAAQMFATLLNGGTNFGTSAHTNFKDANNAWYSPAINYVTQKGLIKGFEDGTFRPNQMITRAEFAQMISGYLQKGFAGTGELKDVKGHWAQDAIDKVYGNKNVAGYPDGTFKPNREITRAEAVTILNSVFNREASAKTIANNGAKTFRDVNANFWAYYQILDAANGHLGN